MTEENASDTSPIVAETNTSTILQEIEDISLEVEPMIAEKNPSDTTPVMAEDKPLDVTPGMTKENLSDDAPIMSEVNPPDTAQVMSEEEKDIQEIPEVTTPEVANSRRFSTGRIGVPDGKSLVCPRYLGSSASSCHDFCKYGKKNNVAVKPWRLARKKTVEMHSEGENVEETETTAMRRKKLGVSLKTCPGSKTEKPDESTIAKWKQTISLKKNSSDSKEIPVIVKCANGPTSIGNSKAKRMDKIGENKEMEDTSRASARVSGTGEPKSNKQKGAGLRDEKKGAMSPPVSLSSKPSVKRVAKIEAKNPKSANGASPLKDPKKTNPEPATSEDVQEKTLYVVESSIKVKSLKGVRSRIQQGPSPSSVGKKNRTSGQGETNADKHPLSFSPSLKDKVSRTTRSETRTVKQAPKPKSTSISPLVKPKGNNPVNRTQSPKTESKSRPKRIGIKLTPTQRLSFRRGKVVDVQPEDSTPRRLKFKRRVLQENPNGKGDAQRRNLKKKDGDGKSDGKEVKPEKVVLRHRKIEGKKQLQTLFNNVIEETATKLAEARKSKVKALVGAFETVISLQDNQTSSPRSRRRSSLAAKG